MRVFTILVLTGFCEIFSVASAAQADSVLTGTSVPLEVGDDYAKPQHFWLTTNGNTTYYNGVGAGNFNPNTLNGVPLDYMYCVDILHTISPGNPYNAQVNTIGYIINDVATSKNATSALTTPTTTGSGTLNPDGINQPTQKNPDGKAGDPTFTPAVLTNAGNIGYLMVNFAPKTTNNNQELALQAAIWTEVYGSAFVLDEAWYNKASNNTNGKNYAEVVTAYHTYLDSIPTGGNAQYIDDVLWINPYTTTATTRTRNGVTTTTYTYAFKQAQVGYICQTPLPGTFDMAASFLGTLVLAGAGKRFRKSVGTAA